VRRYTAATDPAQRDAMLLHARGGTPLAAALVGGKPVVAYVRDQTSADGTMLGAYIAGEDGSELRLSEDGAGATTVALTARTDGAVAAYVDAKRGMSPVHARLVAATPKITLGPDVVTFIAGTAEAYTRVALGSAGAAAFELLPIAHDMSFGLGVVKIDAEPQMDATLAWSDYPNGLDPAPVAATSGAEAVFVARVRPSAAQFGSPRVLELGRLDGAGTFTSFGLVPSRGTTLDVALASDGQDLVLAYTDGAGGWATRLRCGAR
jgi:hypothetical protein